MITNERQHRITRAESRRFEEAIEHAERDWDPTDLDPRLHQAMIEGLRSQLADLNAQIRQYEALRNGRVRRRVLRSLLDLPDALIEARIVRGLSQRELADRLGLVEQQVQRYEATRYAGVAIERLQDVADALGIELKKTIDYHRSPSAASASKSGTAVRKKQSHRGRRVAASALSSSSRSVGKEKAASKARGASRAQTGKKGSAARVSRNKATGVSAQTPKRKPAAKRAGATGAKAAKTSTASKTKGRASRPTQRAPASKKR